MGPDRHINDDAEDRFRTGEEIVLFLADCGPERAKVFGTPYRFVDRYRLDDDGNAVAVATYETVAFEYLLDVIEEEKDNPPLATVSCNY